ncbi:PREDICTED: translocase of chloroplast 159, chloroplastic-like isoform X2 [Ipomoea nil]|uniref:translocase of chloroplast 159, chloroplastic-like isoform X2 n=1 Tax=Ipomoea nil TaxID=35883 RepID=UPI00090094B9|nr:PREDICTED: translocase of chloroplast 159, chloroplastic-like isoform X2 [Ipomoea nil]
MDSTTTGTAQVTPSSQPPFTGIRAPLTIDDSDDFEYSSSSLSNGENNSSISDAYTRSASEASISGEDGFDSNSEMDYSDREPGPNDQTLNHFDYRPSVEYSEGESVEVKSNLDEFDDDYISSLTGPDVGNVGHSGFRQGIPIALLSVDNDDDSEGSVVMEDFNDGFSGSDRSVRVPTYTTVLERIGGSAPKVRVLNVEGEELECNENAIEPDVVVDEGGVEDENAQEKQVVVVDSVPDSVPDCDVEEIKVECRVTSKEQLESTGMQLEEDREFVNLDIDSKLPVVFKWVIEAEPKEFNFFGMGIAKSNLQVGETACLTQIAKNEIQDSIVKQEIIKGDEVKSSDGAENVQISAAQDQLFPLSGTEVDTTHGLAEGDELSRDSNISQSMAINSLPELQINNNKDDNCAFKSVEDEENSFSFNNDDGLTFEDSGVKETIDQSDYRFSCLDHVQNIDGEVITDSNGEVDTIEENKEKETFETAGLGSTLEPSGIVSQLKDSNISAPSDHSVEHKAQGILSEAERSRLEKIQQLRLKFLHLIHRLNQPPEDSIAAQVFSCLALATGKPFAQTEALQFESDGRNNLNLSLNVLVIGKTGVGKSATINSIFHEDKAVTDAFKPATTTVKEMVGTLEGVIVRVLDTPGLRSSIAEQIYNRKVLLSIKKAMKRCPPDVILYVDRLDTQTRDLCDLPLLKSITTYLGPSIWEKTIVTLTHAASSPPDGSTGKPLSYEMFVAQRLHAIQELIKHSVGDLHIMNAGLMNPISLVENQSLCMRNGNGHRENWRSQLLVLCYSMKIVSELSRDPLDPDFEMCWPPLTYFLSSVLQYNVHPNCEGEDVDSDSNSKPAYLSNSGKEDENEGESSSRIHTGPIFKLRGWDCDYGYDQPTLIWGRRCKVGVRAEMNKKLNGGICIRTSSSDYSQIGILCIIITVVKDIIRKIYPQEL